MDIKEELPPVDYHKNMGKYPARMRYMLSKYGVMNHKRCGDCVDFVYGGSLKGIGYKCAMSEVKKKNISWQANWGACGLYSEPTPETPETD